MNLNSPVMRRHETPGENYEPHQTRGSSPYQEQRDQGNPVPKDKTTTQHRQLSIADEISTSLADSVWPTH